MIELNKFQVNRRENQGGNWDLFLTSLMILAISSMLTTNAKKILILGNSDRAIILPLLEQFQQKPPVKSDSD